MTGSAHCSLAPYWGAKLGKAALRAFQASERGGDLDLVLEAPSVILRGRHARPITGEAPFAAR